MEAGAAFYKPSAYFVNKIIRTTRGANACAAVAHSNFVLPPAVDINDAIYVRL
jgi:hypothetical protein